LFNEIGESCSPPLPRAAAEKVREPDFLQTEAYKSKTKTYLTIFFDNPTGEAFHVHHVEKSRFYLYSKWAFLASKSKRAVLCACAILCAMVEHLGAKSVLFDDFYQYFFLRTPSGNDNVDRGLRDLLESGF
jgi:hypothetical protein